MNVHTLCFVAMRNIFYKTLPVATSISAPSKKGKSRTRRNVPGGELMMAKYREKRCRGKNKPRTAVVPDEKAVCALDPRPRHTLRFINSAVDDALKSSTQQKHTTRSICADLKKIHGNYQKPGTGCLNDWVDISMGGRRCSGWVNDQFDCFDSLNNEPPGPNEVFRFN